jgi:hypothetical protein
MNSLLWARRVGVLLLVAVAVTLTAVLGARSEAAAGTTTGGHAQPQSIAGSTVVWPAKDNLEAAAESR